MKDNIDIQILQHNFLELLTMYLEERTTLRDVFLANERIYSRDQKTLPKQLIAVTASIHELKQRIDKKEKVSEETIRITITEAILELKNINE